jgi:hypothetical protein
MGDLNARTGQESDFIENKEHDSNIPLFDDYTPDFNIINRLSQDSTVLPTGWLFNDICIQNFVLNLVLVRAISAAPQRTEFKSLNTCRFSILFS